MQAWELMTPKRLELVEVAKPKLADNEVLLKIKKVGICGTDLHIFSGGMLVPVPLIMGHEFVGEIVELGAGVHTFKINDRAVAEHVIGCGKCEMCLAGRKNLCVKPTIIGLQRPGALAQYLSVPADLVYPLPKELSWDDGVLVEPLSIAVYGVRKAGSILGKNVVVVGQGPIGLFVDQVARAAGAKVWGVDVIESRLHFALEQGYVDGVIDSSHDDPLSTFQKQSKTTGADGRERMRAITATGFGADVVFEVVGQESTMKLALDLVRPGGMVVVLGVFEHDVNISMMNLVKREITVVGSWTCLNTFEPAIQLLKSGAINTDDLITHRYPFERADRAIIEAAQYSQNRIKTVIEMDEE